VKILSLAWTNFLVMAWMVLMAAPALAEEADYLVTAGDFPVTSASNGYVQDVRAAAGGGVTVHVATSLAPIGATETYAVIVAGTKPFVPPGFELRPDLGSWEAATMVLEWAADRVSIDTADTGLQDAASVLERGRGRCSGLANAAVALLRAAGFEARTISGLLVSDGGAIPHRWLECRLPGAGWVATDPTLGLWTVTPRHVAYPATVLTVPEIRVIDAGTDGLERLPRHDGRVVRPNRGADLVCRLPTKPGRWVLEVEVGGLVVERRAFVLRSGDVHSYTVQPLEEGRNRS